MLNISQLGVQGGRGPEPFFGELSDLRYIDVSAAVACIEAHRDRIVGTKVRLSANLADNQPEKEIAGLQGAVEAAQRTGLPCMIHHALSNIPQPEMLKALRPGDIVTHTYHGHADHSFSRTDGAPTASMQRARERRILFDVGHGVGSFVWRIAEAACQQHGFFPDSISTDIHRFNVQGPVFDLTTTMTKFLHLGMGLDQVIRATTSVPARAMGMNDSGSPCSAA